MEVTEALIDKLSKLARLSFNEQENADIMSDVEPFLGLVAPLPALALPTVEPCTHTTQYVPARRNENLCW